MTRHPMTERHRIAGYARADGGFGLHNIVLAVSLIDLANDVAIRIARDMPGVVAVLTPAGGLSFGEEARLIGALRKGLTRNPNVGGVIVIGPTPPTGSALADMAGPGRLVAAVSLLRERDTRAAIDAGVVASRRMLDALAEQRRVEHQLGALAIGLRSSSSSLELARVVNPLVGALVDRVVDAGGTVAFSELADLVGVAEQLATRAISPKVAADIRAAMAGPCRLLASLAAEAPDPTPTNMQGGIATLAVKGRGALRRLGGRPIQGVFPFGEATPGPGLRMMNGPGSAAVCLTGLAAARCTLLVYTVGSTSGTATMPLMPVVRVGPPLLRASRDLDWCAAEEADVDEFIDHVRAIASGQPTVGEPNEARQIMLPGYLPPL